MSTPKAVSDYIGDGGLDTPFPEDDPEYGKYLAEALEAGYRLGLDARPPADAWVPVPLRWRHVAPGDTFVGRESRLWHVGAIGPAANGAGLFADVYSGTNSFADVMDPDDVVNVLVPVTERDAVELCREELGARLIAGRTT